MKLFSNTNSTKAVAVLVATFLCSATTAYADNNSHSFSDPIPALQQSHYLNSYQRSTSTSASTIRFSSITGSQLMNVKAQNLQNNEEYAELKGIGPGYSVGIANTTPAGQMSRLIVTNFDWNLSTPVATGIFVIH